jgi:predicted PurR-regulated permease PerM
MAIKEKDVKRYSAILLVLILAVLSFLIIRPIALSVIGGLLLAYVCRPVYKRVFGLLKEKTTSALAVCVLVVLIVLIPLWFIIPIVMQQIFDAFGLFQSFDVAALVKQILPTSSTQLQVNVTTTIVSFIGKITTSSLSTLTGILLDLPTVLLHMAVVIFVFFFAMRDSDKLKQYVLELSPLKKEKGVELSKQFKQITNSLIYGNFIIGIVQGIAAGIGLLIFGVPKAFLLTVVAIFASVLPIVGPWLVWIPAAIYLFNIGHTTAAIGFSIYSILIVSTIDNFLRPYLVARNAKSSSAVVLVGMIGGLLVFGVLGLLIGPLILEYLILFLEAYKDKTLADMFDSD